MARSKKKRQGDAGLLLPHVSEDALPQQQPLSEEAQHAKATVDLLVRDLFGAKEAERSPDIPIPSHVSGGNVRPPEEGEAVQAPVPEAQADADADVDEDAVLAVEQELEEERIPLEEVEEPLTLREQIESSVEDFRLLLQMDYEDELGNAIGFERIRNYHERELNGKTAASQRARNPRIREYEKLDTDVETEIRRVYSRQKTARILYLSASVLFLILLLLYEQPRMMARMFGGLLDGNTYPVSYILIGIQLLLLDAALCYRQLWEGLVRLARFSPVDVSLTCALLIGTALYHIVLLFVPHTTYPELYLSPAALCLVLLCLSELLNWRRESLAFEIVSARRQKFAMLPRICVGGKEGRVKEALLEGDARERVRYLRPVDFVRHYFNNTAKRASPYRNLGSQLMLILAIGASVGLIAWGMGGKADRVVSTVFMAILLCAPASSMLLYTLPMFLASVLRLRGKGALIGEAPVSECGEPTALVLPDQEIFVGMEHDHFRLSAEGDAHRVSVLARALLERINSPLAQAFSVDVGSRLDPSALQVVEVETNGVMGEIGERRTRVLIGTPAYLARYGLEVTSRASEVAPELYARMLAVAVDDRVAAQFWVRYTAAADVKRLFRDLDRVGVQIAILSKDPCVREDVFARLFPRMNRPVQVIKPSVKEMELRVSRVDSNIVALDSCKELARTYVACRRVRRAGIWGRALQLLSMALGGALSFVLSLIGGSLSAGPVTLWILFWSALYGGLSYLLLRQPSDEI